MEDFTYKFYDTPNLKTIQDDVFEIILKLNSGLLTQQTYLELKPAIFEKVPSLVEFINTFHNWEDIDGIAIIVVLPKSEHLIHRDIGFNILKSKYCFNIPIKNFEYSITKFYKLKEEKKEQITVIGGVPLAHYPSEDVIMIDGLWCNRPCFFNTQIPHGVSNNGDLPRVLISIRPRTPFNLEIIFK
jgi:hypothetical protein